MGFIGTAQMSTNAFSQLFGGKQASRFHKSLLGMHPAFSSIGLRKATFSGQKERQDAHPFALLLDLTVMLSDPGLHGLAVMPGGIVPDQQKAGLALCLQPGADPLQKLRGDAAFWAPIHKTQRHLAAERRSSWTLLPKDPIPGKGFWIRIILLPDLFHQVDWLIFALPGMQRG